MDSDSSTYFGNRCKKAVHPGQGITGRISGLVGRVPDESKDEFRQFYLSSDINQAKLGILLLVVPIAVFAFNDYQFLGLTFVFYGFLVLRLGLVAYTALLFAYLRKVTSYRSYDKSIFAYLLIIGLGNFVFSLSRPQNAIAQIVFISLGIFIVYLIVNTKFVNQVILASSLTVEQTLIILLNLQLFTSQALFTAFLSLSLANIIAATSSWQLHSYRLRLFKDIYERKKADRLAVIGQTVGMVGHDIRNPLQAITGDVYLACTELDSFPDTEEKEHIRESLEAIEGNVEYIDKIVADLQDYAKPLKIDTQKVDLEKSIQTVLQRRRIPENIKTTYHIEKDASKIVTDSRLLQRILNNLVINAVQAMPNGGNLSIVACRNPKGVVIIVEDTGVGIPDAVKPSCLPQCLPQNRKDKALA